MVPLAAAINVVPGAAFRSIPQCGREVLSTGCFLSVENWLVTVQLPFTGHFILAASHSLEESEFLDMSLWGWT